MKLIVMAPGGAPLLGGDALIDAAHARFGEDARVQRSPEGWETDFHLYVALPAESLTVSHFADNSSVSFESGDEEVADAVAWYRSLLPVEFPRVIACDPGWNGHVDLTPGITAEAIAASWIDHGVPGWDSGDPDFG